MSARENAENQTILEEYKAIGGRRTTLDNMAVIEKQKTSYCVQ